MRSRHALATVISAALGALLMTAGLLVASAGGASGDGGECAGGQAPVWQAGAWICAIAVDPGSPGGDGEDVPAGSGGDGASPGCRNSHGVEMPCSTTEDTYDLVFMEQCDGYAWKVDPPPPASDPSWGGHDPSEGTVYTCDPTACGQGTGGCGFFVPGGSTPPDPAEMARRAAESLPLDAPTIHMAPEPPAMTYVGLETWLWIESGQWRDLSASVSAGSTTVAVVARPVSVDWDLTEGTTSCGSGGRAWVKGMSSSERTDCSYTFGRVSNGEAGGEFAVTAVVTYAVTWTCRGTCLSAAGDLGEVSGAPGTSAIRVGERQSVVVG